MASSHVTPKTSKPDAAKIAPAAKVAKTEPDALRVARAMRALADYHRDPKALSPESRATVQKILDLFPAS